MNCDFSKPKKKNGFDRILHHNYSRKIFSHLPSLSKRRETLNLNRFAHHVCSTQKAKQCDVCDGQRSVRDPGHRLSFNLEKKGRSGTCCTLGDTEGSRAKLNQTPRDKYSVPFRWDSQSYRHRNWVAVGATAKRTGELRLVGTNLGGWKWRRPAVTAVQQWCERHCTHLKWSVWWRTGCAYLHRIFLNGERKRSLFLTQWSALGDTMIISLLRCVVNPDPNQTLLTFLSCFISTAMH